MPSTPHDPLALLHDGVGAITAIRTWLSERSRESRAVMFLYGIRGTGMKAGRAFAVFVTAFLAVVGGSSCSYHRTIKESISVFPSNIIPGFGEGYRRIDDRITVDKEYLTIDDLSIPIRFAESNNVSATFSISLRTINGEKDGRIDVVGDNWLVNMPGGQRQTNSVSFRLSYPDGNATVHGPVYASSSPGKLTEQYLLVELPVGKKYRNEHIRIEADHVVCSSTVIPIPAETKKIMVFYGQHPNLAKSLGNTEPRFWIFFDPQLPNRDARVAKFIKQGDAWVADTTTDLK